MRKKTAMGTTTTATSGPPIVSVPSVFQMPNKEPWYRSILTDHAGDFDFGAISVGVGVLALCFNSGWDVIVNHAHFDAMQFGTGMGAMLIGFAGYKYGDAKRPEGTTTTITATQQAAP